MGGGISQPRIRHPLLSTLYLAVPIKQSQQPSCLLECIGSQADLIEAHCSDPGSPLNYCFGHQFSDLVQDNSVIVVGYLLHNHKYVQILAPRHASIISYLLHVLQDMLQPCLGVEAWKHQDPPSCWPQDPTVDDQCCLWMECKFQLNETMVGHQPGELGLHQPVTASPFHAEINAMNMLLGVGCLKDGLIGDEVWEFQVGGVVAEGIHRVFWV